MRSSGWSVEEPTIYQHLMIRKFHVFLVIRHLWKSASFKIGANLELLSARLQGGIRFLHIMYPLAHRLTLPLAVSSVELMRDNWAYSERSLQQRDGLGSAYSPGDWNDCARWHATIVTVHPSRAISGTQAMWCALRLLMLTTFISSSCILTIPSFPAPRPYETNSHWDSLTVHSFLWREKGFGIPLCGMGNYRQHDRLNPYLTIDCKDLRLNACNKMLAYCA